MPRLIRAFQITWILIINIRLKIRYFITDKGRKNVKQFVDFFSLFRTVFNHNAVQLSDILKTGNRIFASGNRIKIAFWDLILLN